MEPRGMSGMESKSVTAPVEQGVRMPAKTRAAAPHNNRVTRFMLHGTYRNAPHTQVRSALPGTVAFGGNAPNAVGLSNYSIIDAEFARLSHLQA